MKDIEKRLNALGISIYHDDGSVKYLKNILEDITNIWEEIVK